MKKVDTETTKRGRANWAARGALTICMLISAAVAPAQGTSATVKDDLFAGTEKFAQGATGVNEISMDPDSLGLVSGDNARRAHGLVLNVVRTYEYDKPGLYRLEDVDIFRKKLETGDWHCSVHTRDLKRGDSTDICNRRRTDGMVETAIITVAPKELTFIHTIRRGGEGGRSFNGGLPGSFGEWPFSAEQFDQWSVLGPKWATQFAVGIAKLQAMGPSPEMVARLAEMRARLEAGGLRTGTPAPSAPKSPDIPATPRQPE